jgi:hypothetical protein
VLSVTDFFAILLAFLAHGLALDAVGDGDALLYGLSGLDLGLDIGPKGLF